MSMETSSMASATTCSSLNSVEEEEDQDQEENEEDDDFLGNSMHSRNSSSNPKPKGRRQDDDDEEEEEVEEVEEEPAKARAARGKGSTLRREGSTPLSPTAQAAVSGDLQALKEALMAAKSEAQWTSEQLKDSEKALAAKETQLKEAQEDIGRLEADLEAALRVQEELMEENERAEQDYQDLLSKVESGASSKQVDQVQLQHLRAEIDRLKEEATALRGERNDLKQALANEQQTIKKAAEEASAGAQATKQISELEDSLQKEKAKAAKFKGWLEKMTEQKAALESELAEVQERLAEEEASSRAKPSSAAATGGADVSKVSDADKDKMTAEMNKMAAEMERISLQLVHSPPLRPPALPSRQRPATRHVRRLGTRLLVFRVGGTLEAVEGLPACACVLGCEGVCVSRSQRKKATPHCTYNDCTRPRRGAAGGGVPGACTSGAGSSGIQAAGFHCAFCLYPD
jgi:DNA repair exonuclease SbcCD ATPase subunit